MTMSTFITHDSINLNVQWAGEGQLDLERKLVHKSDGMVDD